MSPPCQPFTRQHPATENDPRCNALNHLIKSLTKLKNKPKYLALENVIGFEESPTCKILLEMLESTGYEFRQFALTPTQFGVPNERPRYYLLAVLEGVFNESNIDNMGSIYNEKRKRTYKSNMDVLTSIPNQKIYEINDLNYYVLNQTLANIEVLLVPEKSLEKNASWCLDIATKNDKYTSCFTKSYSKYFKGTGSVLLIPDPYLKNKNDSLNENNSVNDSNNLINDKTNLINDINCLINEINGVIKANDNKDNEYNIRDDKENNIQNNSSSSANAMGENINTTNIIEIIRIGEKSGESIDSKITEIAPLSDDFRQDPELREFDLDWKKKLNGQKLRFFSPNELLQLFGFIAVKMRENTGSENTDFKNSEMNDHNEKDKKLKKSCNSSGGRDDVNEISEYGNSSISVSSLNKEFFPANITNRKCYELIGNSLSVTVVSHLLEYLFQSTSAIRTVSVKVKIDS